MFAGEFARRLRFFLQRRRRTADLELEMRLHRELRSERLVREGVDPAEAASAAERRFGNKTLLQEESVGMWSWQWLDDLANDTRHTIRLFAANPLFTAVAVLTLALGIGANTAIFSVANAILFRAMPVHDPQQTFYLHVEPGQPSGASNTGNSNSSFSAYVFEQLRQRGGNLAGVVAYVPADTGKVGIRLAADPEEATAYMVSGDFFSTLGVNALCGRMLTLADEREHAAVAVLSYAFWTRRFEQSCAAIGRKFYLKGVPVTVVGVAPKSFPGIEASAVDLWLPLQKRPELNAWGSEESNYYVTPNWWCLRLLVRLAPGIAPGQANALLDPVFQHAAYEPLGGRPKKGETPRKLVFVSTAGVGDSADDLRRPLYVLLAMVGVILVIACGNVAMLLAARNEARQKEFSVRMAIGGSRGRLFRQLLAESLALVAGGAALGWIFSLVATRALAAWGRLQISLEPDAHVLLFTIAASLAAALAFGFAPLITALRTPISMALKSAAATAFRERSRSRFARVTVAAQIALCLTLLVAAGLLVRTLRNLQRENLGMRTSGLLVFGLSPHATDSSEAVRFFNGLLAKLQAQPGIQNATLMENRLGSGWSNNTTPIVDGQNGRTIRPGSMRWNKVGPNYFTTLGVPVRLGRDFSEADGVSAPKVAIVNEAFVRIYFENREPLGHLVSFTPRLAFTVVGVVANSKYTSVREKEMPMAWFPYAQAGGSGTMHIELRTAGEPAAFLPQVRRAVAEYARDLPLLSPTSQKAEFDETISQERLVARLSLCFGILAVLLVATGLYGTLAYRVRRRTAELGIRMAMGAQRSALLWMIVRESLATAALGGLIGLPLTVLAARALQSLLYGLAPNDFLAFASGVIGIFAVSLAASLVPAVRAASMNPVSALRYE